jgi:hypothetical protein
MKFQNASNLITVFLRYQIIKFESKRKTKLLIQSPNFSISNLGQAVFFTILRI